MTGLHAQSTGQECGAGTQPANRELPLPLQQQHCGFSSSHVRESRVGRVQGCILVEMTDTCHMLGWRLFELLDVAVRWIFFFFFFLNWATDLCEGVVQCFKVVLVKSYWMSSSEVLGTQLLLGSLAPLPIFSHPTRWIKAFRWVWMKCFLWWKNYCFCKWSLVDFHKRNSSFFFG